MDDLSKLREEAAAFAGELSGRTLAAPTSVSAWHELLALLKERGWLGAGLRDLREAGTVLEGLSRGGASVGIPLTLTVHYIMALHVLGTFYPEGLGAVLESGGLCCMAASEPKVGSHPGKIETRAVHEDGNWRVSGFKVFTTGGPVASHLLVLAVCGGTETRRELGLFVVPTDAPGVTVKEMPVHPGLETALHAATTFENAPALTRIGGEGEENGWTQIVRPFRQWEDSLLQSWVAGTARREARAALSALLELGVDESFCGRLLASTEALCALARDSAQSLLDEQAGAPRESLLARRYGFFEQLRATERIASEIRGALGDKTPPPALAAMQGLFNQIGFAARAREKLLAQAASQAR